MYEEVRMWIGIKSVIEAYLMDYHSSYENDLEIIAKDDIEHTLTYNERNIITFLS